MIKILKAQMRGNTNYGWLDSKHSFSFADFYNPEQMGFRTLRVINDDRILGGTGFDTHGHSDMEIVSYVVDGALEHRDSMGNSTVIKPGEVQRMSAGSGIMHSEHNHYKDKTGHFLQIWILPEQRGITPSYQQKDYSQELNTSKIVLVASKTGRDNSLSISQDVEIYACKSIEASSANLNLRPNRHLWIQMVRGKLNVLNKTLLTGDGAAISDETSLDLSWDKDSEFLIFDLQ